MNKILLLTLFIVANLAQANEKVCFERSEKNNVTAYFDIPKTICVTAEKIVNSKKKPKKNFVKVSGDYKGLKEIFVISHSKYNYEAHATLKTYSDVPGIEGYDLTINLGIFFRKDNQEIVGTYANINTKFCEDAAHQLFCKRETIWFKKIK